MAIKIASHNVVPNKDEARSARARLPIAYILVALPPFRCSQNESGPVHLDRLWATFILNSGRRKER